MTTDESVVTKIKKLLALADGNQNEHEREVAMRFALELLAKHNLSLKQVNGSLLNTETQVSEIQGYFRLDPWIRTVLSASCKLYYTDYYIKVEWLWWQERNRKTPVFVGTAENIAVTIDVADWLIKSIRKESNWMYKEEFERRSFRLGAADRIMERVLQMTEAEKQGGPDTNSSSNSLMVLRHQLERANREHLAKLNLREGRSRSSIMNISAYEDGTVFGDEVKLGRHDAAVRGRITTAFR
jgi:hypothetical protein